MHICTIQLLTAFRVFLASNSICSQIGQPNNAQRYACAPYMRMPQQSLCVPRRIISLPSSSRLASGSSWHTHTHTRSVAHCATKHVPDQRAFTCPDRDRVCELCLARALGEWRRAAAAHTHGVSSLPLRSSPLSLRATLAVCMVDIYIYVLPSCRQCKPAYANNTIGHTHSHSRAARDRLQNAYKQIVRNNVCVCWRWARTGVGGGILAPARISECARKVRVHTTRTNTLYPRTNGTEWCLGAVYLRTCQWRSRAPDLKTGFL